MKEDKKPTENNEEGGKTEKESSPSRSVCLNTLHELCSSLPDEEETAEDEEEEEQQKGEGGDDAAAGVVVVGSDDGERGFSFGQFCEEAVRVRLPETPQEAEDVSKAIAEAASGAAAVRATPQRRHLFTAMLRNALEVQADRNARGLGVGKGSRSSRFVDLETGIRMRYVQFTRGAGASASTVLFIHDLGDNAESFATLVSELTSYYVQARRERAANGDDDGGESAVMAVHQHQYIGVDIRGHGLSTHSLDHSYTVDAIANDIVKFIVQRDLYKKKCVLVGAGMGAVIATAVAARYVHRIRT